MTKEQRTAILFIQNAIIREIKHNERSKKVDKLTRHIAQAIRHILKHDKETFTLAAKLSEAVVTKVQKQIDGKHFTIMTSATLVTLHDMYDDCKFYSRKTFDEAIRSIESCLSNAEVAPSIAKDSITLVDMLAEELGLPRVNKLSGLKAKLEAKQKLKKMDAILEGVA